jgi:hypothetical protein
VHGLAVAYKGYDLNKMIILENFHAFESGQYVTTAKWPIYVFGHHCPQFLGLYAMKIDLLTTA